MVAVEMVYLLAALVAPVGLVGTAAVAVACEAHLPAQLAALMGLAMAREAEAAARVKARAAVPVSVVATAREVAPTAVVLVHGKQYSLDICSDSSCFPGCSGTMACKPHNQCRCCSRGCRTWEGMVWAMEEEMLAVVVMTGEGAAEEGPTETREEGVEEAQVLGAVSCRSCTPCTVAFPGR